MEILPNIGRSIHLTVLSGVNSGAEVTLPRKEMVIGGAEDDDLIFDGLPPGALQLKPVGSELRVTPLATSVTIDNAILPLGEAARISLPARLLIDGSVSVFVGEVGPKPGASAGPDKRLIYGAAAAGGILALALLIFQIAGTSQPTPEAVPAAAPQAVAEAPICATDCVAEAEISLRAALEGTALAQLRIASGDGAIRVSGALPETLRPLWTSIRVQYDSQWARRVPLVADITAAPTEQPIRVSAVWLGDEPEVIDVANLRYRIGDRTADGWVLEAIEAQSIVLSRDGVRLVLSY